MSIYTKKAFDSTKGRGSKDLSEDLRKTEQQSRQTYRQFGGTGPSIGLSSRDRADATRDFQIGDEKRREAATSQLAGLAGNIDKRRSSIGDAISDSLDAQTQAEVQAAGQLGRASESADLSKRQTTAQTEDALRDISFKEYQSQAQRNDKIEELYQKGSVESVLQDAIVDGKLRQMDIEHYYNLLMQDIGNAFEMWKVTNDWKAKDELESLVNKAQNISAIIEGTTQTLNALYQGYNQGGNNANSF